MLRKEGEKVTKHRLDYVYRAYRIDHNNPQALGDFSISRKIETPYGPEYRLYHYASSDYPYRWRRNELTNRHSLILINPGSRIHDECMKAIDRLIEEENRLNET